MNLRIRDFPENEKPREKLFRYGASEMSNSELLAIILGNGTKNMNVVDLSSRIMRMGMSNLAKMRISELKKIEGIGFAKACQIVACFELGKRLFSLKASESPQIRCAEDAYSILEPLLTNQDKENFVVLFLDVKKKLIRHEIVFVGTLDSSVVHPREIFKAAVKESAAAIIVAHNHPSGETTPSKEDINITKQLVKAGEIIGIPLIDHIIIGRGYTSLKSLGEIF